MNDNNKASSRTKPVELTHDEAVALTRAARIATFTDNLSDEDRKHVLELIERLEGMRFP